MSDEDDSCGQRGFDEQVEAEPDYENRVGYRMPPKQHRWRKGMSSPNPGGRPRKKMTRKYYLEQVAYRIITVTEIGRSRQMSALEAVILKIKSKAIAGNKAASRIYDSLQGIVAPEEDEPDVGRAVLFTRGRMTEEEWVAEAAAYLEGKAAFGRKAITEASSADEQE